MKKIGTLIVLLTAVMGLVGCSNKSTVDPSNNSSRFTATVIAIADDYLMVKVTDKGNTNISVGSEATVSLKDLEIGYNILVGDNITVEFNGEVMEKDPLSLGKIYSIQKEMKEQNHSDWGITLSVDNVTSKGLTLYIIQSGGEPTGELRYGSDYHLQVLEDGNWRAVPYATWGDVGWNDEAYMVVMDAATPLDIYWERLYGSIPAGTYRISKGFMDFRGSGDYDSQSFYAEFEIK